MSDEKPKFQPSVLSYSPQELELRRIGSMKAALERIEADLKANPTLEIPRWVEQRILRSASELATVINYFEAVKASKTRRKRT